MQTHLLFTIVLATFTSMSSAQSRSSNAQWPGWSNISHIFSFGDSYTDTRFQMNDTAPNAANPLGNPPFPGRTSSNGRNWIDFLTYEYNESSILTYNLARGGASVSSFDDRTLQFRPFDIQVDQLWMPNYAPNVTSPLNLTSPRPDWKGNDTLFTVFFGINDINFSSTTSQDERDNLHDTIFEVYTTLLNTLHDSGARNFLLMNVPPVHRAPFTVTQQNSERVVRTSLSTIQDFNARLNAMADDFMRDNTEVTLFLFDNFGLYNEVLDDPNSKPETSVYTNTTGFCTPYSLSRNYNESSFNTSCGTPQREYFWLDSLHPTPPIHDAMAAGIADLLKSNQTFEFSNSPSSNAPSGTGGSSRTMGDVNSALLYFPALCATLALLL